MNYEKLYELFAMLTISFLIMAAFSCLTALFFCVKYQNQRDENFKNELNKINSTTEYILKNIQNNK